MATLPGGIILLLCITCLATASKIPETANQENFSFEDIFDSRFDGASVQAEWFQDTNSLTYYDSTGDLVLHDVSTNDITVLVPSENNQFPSSTYALSPNQDYVAFKYDFKWFTQEFMGTIHRVSIYNIETGEVTEYPNDNAIRGKILSGFQWTNSGAGSLFVYEGNVYHQDSPEAGAVTQITDTGDGNVGQIRNGFWFWNDNFGRNPASTLSPNDRYVLIGESRFSDNFPTSGHAIYGDVDSAYYKTYMQYYVKANPDFFSDTHLYLYDMNDFNVDPIELLPPAGVGNEYYNMHIMWMDTSRVAVTWGTRLQNEQYCVIYDVTADPITQITNFYEEVNNGWNHNLNMLRTFDNGNQYVSILSNNVGEQGSYKQVAILSSGENAHENIQYLTDKATDTWWIVGMDEAEGHVYYTGVYQSITDRHLFRVTIPEGNDPVEEPVCMTCDLAPDCDYVSASFSQSGDYYILGCLGPDVPTYRIRGTVDELDFLIEDNAALVELLASRVMPSREMMEIEFAEGFVGMAEIIYPPVLTPTMLYPVLMYPYNGPHNAQQVTKAYKGSGFFGSGYENYMAVSENVITVRIDGRGTGMNGDAFQYAVYKQLGVLETQDQIFGVQNIIERFDKANLDINRIAVYGHSYGGFMAGNILSDPSNVVKCGLASAPVVSWRWYSAIYTERYMGIDRQNDNAEGYASSSLIHKIEGLKGKHIMITHGTHDDNVHAQNSLQWLKVLARGDYDYISYIYADENHYLLHVLRHEARMFTKMMTEQCFKVDEDPDNEEPNTDDAASLKINSFMLILCTVVYKYFTNMFTA